VDPNIRALLDPDVGPFAHCVDGHQTAEPLPVFTPPDGLFFDQRESRD
jgi:hypothetical protein